MELLQLGHLRELYYIYILHLLPYYFVPVKSWHNNANSSKSGSTVIRASVEQLILPIALFDILVSCFMVASYLIGW